MFLRDYVSAGNFYDIYSLFKNYKLFSTIRPYWKSLELEERLIMLIPFLTTIDTCIINMATMNKPKRMSELFQHVPLRFLGMISSNHEISLVNIVANDADNPGNSVFGPKGVICPGNIVTSMLVKSMMDLMNNLDYEVIGTPEFGGSSTITRISNAKEIKIITRAYNGDLNGYKIDQVDKDFDE